jgi:hypothetical protein
MCQKGKSFEIAVYEFLKALAPGSKVDFDCKIPDKDTGELRQVDAWVVANIGGHIPVSILISCKDYKRKLNVSHIETFLSEINSTSASTGVIYSSSGFSSAALKKAKVNGISCCQLFRGKPVSLPPKLFFNSYVCKPRLALILDKTTKEKLYNKGVISWDKLLEIKVKKDITLLEAIDRAYINAEKEAISIKNLKNMLPPDWETTIRFSEIDNENDVYTIKIKVLWAIFQGKAECHLFNGSYCFTNNAYLGNMKGPAIDTYDFHPGSSWFEVKRGSQLPKANTVAIFLQADIKKTLETYFKGKNIT